MSNGNDPINPVPYTNSDGTIHHDVFYGLTKREYFAVKALQGVLSNEELRKKVLMDSKLLMDSVDRMNAEVKYSIKIADNLLAELAKPPTP